MKESAANQEAEVLVRVETEARVGAARPAPGVGTEALAGLRCSRGRGSAGPGPQRSLGPPRAFRGRPAGTDAWGILPKVR